MAQMDHVGSLARYRYRFASPHGLLYAVALSAMLWGAIALFVLAV